MSSTTESWAESRVPTQPRPSRRQDQRPSAHLLWNLTDLTRWGTAITFTMILLVGSWYVVSGRPTWNEQIPAMGVGIVSVVIANAASLGLLLAGRRAIGIRRQALLGEAPVPAETAQAWLPQDSATRSVVPLVGAAGLRHYHRADCTMAVGRDWPSATRSQHEDASRQPCGLCRP